jgi:hypothetical protein
VTWSVVQSYGNASNKTSGTSIKVFSPGTYSLTVGHVLVAHIVCDNADTTTGASSLVSSVVGLNSGTFTKAGEHTHSPTGAAADGVTVSVWYKRVTASAVAGDDEVTFTLGTAVTAKCAGVYIFSTDQAEVNVKAFVGDVAIDALDPMTLSGLPSREYLFLRNNGAELGSFGYTPSTNYTGYGVNTTTDPGNATDVQTTNEYRIFTGTGDTTDPAITGTYDSASLYFAFVDAPLIDPVSSLIDNFDDNSLDTAKWTSFNDPNVTVSEVRGRLEIAPPANATGYGGISSVNIYDLTGSSAYLRLVQKLNAGAGPETVYWLGPDSNNWVGFFLADNEIHAGYNVAGTRTLANPTIYSPSTHAWLRVRESGGTTYWETAPDTASNPPVSTDWVAFYSLANPIAVTSVIARIEGGTWAAVADPGTAIFDGFNAKLSPPPLPAETASFSITGSAAALLKKLRLPTSSATFTITGVPVVMSKGFTMPVSTGSYAITTQPASLRVSKILPAETASISITGNAATVKKGWYLPAETGSFTISATEAELAEVFSSGLQRLFYQQHLATQAKIRGSLHTSTPNKTTLESATQADKAIKKAKKAKAAKRQALKTEIAELEEEIAALDEIEQFIPTHMPALQMLAPMQAALAANMPLPVDPEEEQIIELLLLQLV